MKGTKKVEFRKRAFAREVSHVVVYASSPVMRVLGWFSVDGIDEGTPDELWGRHGSVGGVLKRDYRAYFGASTNAVAIRVGNIHPLANPLELKEVFASGRAPQSYAYLDPGVVTQLRRRKAGADWTWGDRKRPTPKPAVRKTIG